MIPSQEELIIEEQEILDRVLVRIRDDFSRNDKLLQQIIRDRDLAVEKVKVMTDGQADLVGIGDKREAIIAQLKRIKKASDELYRWRLVLNCKDIYSEGDRVDLYIGLHEYTNVSGHSNLIITNYAKNPIARHFVLNSDSLEFDNVVVDKGGEYRSHYDLMLKREVNIFFSIVTSVKHYFPYDYFRTVNNESKVLESNEVLADEIAYKESEEEIRNRIYDEFLVELLTRRGDQEFSNIIFSIQKKQSEIIQKEYKQNLIVQGCAGSGKSMIMLHRLPLVLFDNPNSVKPSTLYIISPSETYIKMADKMRHELEIEECEMGTVSSYYSHVLERYRIDKLPEKIGKIDNKFVLNKGQEDYVYSSQCIEDINESYLHKINDSIIEYTAWLKMYELTAADIKSELPSDLLSARLLDVDRIIEFCDAIIRERCESIANVFESIRNWVYKIEKNKSTILTNIDRKMVNLDGEINKQKVEIDKLDKDKNQIAYNNRNVIIERLIKDREKLLLYTETIQNDESYFSLFEKIVSVSKRLDSISDICQKAYSILSIEDKYVLLEHVDLIVNVYSDIQAIFNNIELKYTEYSDNFISSFGGITNLISGLINGDTRYIQKEEYLELKSMQNRLSVLQKTIVQDVYLEILNRLGLEADKKGIYTVPEFSLYLYLQMLYLFYGAPSGVIDSLVAIDEAQSLAVNEIRLIKKVNRGSSILNLFGDVRQHFEGDKGIENWDDISDIADFEVCVLNENYRNASNITEYCNNKLGMEMFPINSPGSKVNEFMEYNSFVGNIRNIIAPKKIEMSSAVIVNDINEAEWFISTFAEYKKRFHDMTGGNAEISMAKWNILTVDDAKGLEFGKVIVISSNMTNNRKYVAYTRAMDALYVYDGDAEMLKICSKASKDSRANSTNAKMEKKKRKKAQKVHSNVSSAETVDVFLRKAGCEIQDDRSAGGYLWVIGEKSKIENIINKAVSIYNISGIYTSSPAIGNKAGWCTRARRAKKNR